MQERIFCLENHTSDENHMGDTSVCGLFTIYAQKRSTPVRFYKWSVERIGKANMIETRGFLFN
ncbi:predicted protein [Sclerotinia sclerotiorum 1980 UF-70]|uniref:Uncharacterized protein n=1 Tax=Sclerotinia sclerotiorum (strain ATCC 18683 / 1980 / Ss-1) TaxID=665079 RepID=A7EMN7_SCLS1|nr:predicted protein [Sclerotinia sclerotiorum 1980 UF-70]EDO04103.1 predicted protein [Sclerotinia sclerotiorum 1980 UF-70]